MQEEKNINLVLKEAVADEKPLLTLHGIAQQIKRFAVLWLVCALALGLIAGCGSLMLTKNTVNVKAAIEFTFSGVEDGKDPAGNEFDAAKQLRSPIVLKNALNTLNYTDAELNVDDLREALKVSSVIPEDAVDELTAYKSAFNVGSNNAMSAVQAMLNVSYHPSRFIINFIPADLGLSAEEGVEVLNAVLSAYKQYFYETYGYNKALGVAVLAIDYHDYDYERAIDVFDTSLESAQRYVNSLANEDTTGFRSVTTGYSFTDLANAIGTLRNEDLGWITSFVTINNVTKDKQMLLTYYAYLIENLTLQKTEAETNLISVQESIDKYEKDSIVVVGGDQYGKDLNLSQSSEQYDKMINRKLTTQETIAQCTKDIAYYEQRVNELRMANTVSTNSQMQELDEKMDKLYGKITTLLETVDATAAEFYENVAFQNACSVVVPAAAERNTIVQNTIMIVLVLEAMLFVVFAVIIVIRAFTLQYRKNHLQAEGAAKDADAAETDAIAISVADEKDATENKGKNSKKDA
ncbi:MAG: hypothetical protein PUC41_00545 [Oscillospiraceae bacterium]|nr:hypothetical protein [Oscillospiraceae bacterium]